MERVTKRARARAARDLAMATRVASNKQGNGNGNKEGNGNSNNRGNCYSDKGGGHATAATMAMGMGMAPRSGPLVLRLERRGRW